MEKERPYLRLVPGPSRAQLALEKLANAPFVSGTWGRVLERRADMLARDYRHPDIPEGDTEGRMSRLKADLMDAIRAKSVIRAREFPFEHVRDARAGICAANAVDQVAGEEGPMSDRAQRNRERHFRALVDALMRAAVVTHREGAEAWLHDNGRHSPSFPDLTWLAVAEMNADRIGAALPRVPVLPNFHHAFNPFFVWVDDSIRVDVDTAGFLRTLFER